MLLMWIYVTHCGDLLLSFLIRGVKNNVSCVSNVDRNFDVCNVDVQYLCVEMGMSVI